MNVKEMLGENYREGMSAEDIIKALERVKSPEKPAEPEPGQETPPNFEAERLKAAVTKANKEAAEYKRQLQAKMTEDERREAERKAKEDEVNEKLAELQRAKVVADTKAQFLALGYEQSLADRAAEASADNDHATLFLVQKQHLDAYGKKLRADILKNTPKPNASASSVPKDLTKEQFASLNYTDRLAIKQENPELYQELKGE